jgi:hypothetical protein
MSNVAGKAYGMNVVTPMKPPRTWLNKFIFMVSRAFPGTLGGLLGLSLIHFARWVIIGRDKWPERGQRQKPIENDLMLFCSNFNGTWDQYIDAFADALPGGLDILWYSSTKYPGSIPITPFKNYIRANQVDTNYYYNATPGSAQRDIKLALALAQALQAVELTATDDELAAAYRKVLLGGQGQLGSPGYAPVASCDTAIADLHRCAEVRKRWGPKGEGPPPAEHVIHPVAAATVEASPVEAEPAAKQEVRAAVTAMVGGAPRTDEAAPLPPAEGGDHAQL